MVDQAAYESPRATLFGKLPVPLTVDSLLDAVSDFVLAVDRDGKYLWAAATNPRSAAEGLLETARDRAQWLIGRTLYDVFPPEDAKRLHAAVRTALDSGEKQSISYRVEPWQEESRWFDATITRLTSDIVLWAARDVTDVKRSRHELEAWKERHLSLINSVDAIVWEADVPFSRFYFVSDQAERLLGYPVERWLNEPNFWVNHMHPDDVGWCVPFCALKTAAGEPHDFEYRMIAADGRTVWLRDIVTVVREDGRPVSLRGVMVDITSLKETFSRLSEQEQEYRAIFEATSDGLIINDLETGLVLAANPAACRMHGYDDMVGLDPKQFIHPDSHHLFDDYIQSIQAGREFRRRAQDVRSDGTVLDVEVLGRGFIYQGRPAVLGVVRDITEQVRSERMMQEAFASLSEREEQYRSIFESTGDSLLIHSLDDRYSVITANPAACEMWGYSHEDIIGLTIDRMFSPNDPQLTAFAEDVRQRKIAHLRTRAFKSDGSAFDIESTGVPFTVKGQPHLMCIQRDVTERVRYEQVLEEKVQARTGELAALLEVSRKVTSTLDLRSLLQIAMDSLRSMVPSLGASVAIVEDGALVTIASQVAPGRKTPDAALGVRIPLEKAPDIWSQLERDDTIIIDDVRSDEPAALAYRQAVGDLLSEDAMRYIRSWMGVPLRHQDALIGLLSLSTDQTAFYTEEHARLARAVAAQTALAIENARLYQQAQKLAAVEERQRLARELHDSVSQALYGIALGARTARTHLDIDSNAAAEPLDYVLSLAEAGLAEMRALIFDLRPDSLEAEGLVSAVRRQIVVMEARHDISVTFDAGSEPDVPLEIKENVYRIIRESLHNIVKHARASNVVVTLKQQEETLLLSVTDDGDGFDPRTPFPGHVGLASMSERAQRLGATLDIESSPGSGTAVRCAIPIARRRK